MKGEEMNISMWFKDRKTYLVSALTIAASIAMYYGVVIPPFVWPIAGALGLGALRLGVAKMTDEMKK